MLTFCLYPSINEALKGFLESWNNHPIATAHNLTPNQLFIRGAQEQRQELNEPDGVSLHGLTPQDYVTVPRSSFLPCSCLKQTLGNINPLRRSLDGGTSIYNETIDIVGQHLANGCNNCEI